MAKHKHEGEEPVGWVTVRGIHFPKWKDGTIGWQQGEEATTKKKEYSDAIEKMATKHVNKIMTRPTANAELYDEVESWAKKHGMDVKKMQDDTFKRMNKLHAEAIQKERTEGPRERTDKEIMESYKNTSTEQIEKTLHTTKLFAASNPDDARHARHAKIMEQVLEQRKKKKHPGLEKAKEKTSEKKSVFGKQMDDEISNYQSKYLSKRSDAEIAELKKNLETSGKITGTSKSDQVALAAIERELESRKQSTPKTTSKNARYDTSRATGKTDKSTKDSKSTLSEKHKKVASQYLGNVMWKKSIDGEESAEISANHFSHAGVSNEKMISILNAYDKGYEYRLEQYEEMKKQMGMKMKVKHQYIVRDKKK